MKTSGVWGRRSQKYMTNREKIRLHEAWWHRENPEPLVAPFIPATFQYGGLDIAVPPTEIAARKKADSAVAASLPGDRLTVACVNFGPAFLPALAGAGFEHDGHTSWSVPAFHTAAEAKVRPFDPNHPLFVEYRRRLEPLLENWSWDTYLPGLADYLGPVDIAAGLLGPETLAMEILDNPDAVRRLAGETARFVADALDFERDLHRQAGVSSGTTECFGVWLPGRGARLSEDFAVLVGPKAYDAFFVEADALACRNCDHVFMHVHSAACRHVSGFLGNPAINAIELGNDPNGPGLDERLAAARRIQQSGRALQFGSWNIPLPAAEIEQAMKSLDPAGLIVSFQLQPGEDAAEHIAWVKSLSPAPRRLS